MSKKASLVRVKRLSVICKTVYEKSCILEIARNS